MEPIKPTATLTGNTGDQHSQADGDAASGTIGGLPFHLTEKILCRIIPLESVLLAAVCKSWAATVSERLATPTPHLFALQVQVLHDTQGDRRGAIFSLPIVDQEESTSPVIPFPARLPGHAKDAELFGPLPCGSLCFVDDNRVVLVNPVTGTLQSIEMHTSRARRRFQMEPIKLLRTAAGANAIFFAVAEYFARTISLLRCEEEEDEEKWFEEKVLLAEEFRGSDDAIRFAAYAGGIFYAMDSFGFMHMVDTRAPPPQRLTRLHAPSMLQHYSWRSHLRNFHLLASQGEVLFLRPVFAPTVCPESIGGFEVYRLDVEGSQWVRVESLADDRALFVSQQSSFAVRASETPGCMGNCIYFVSELGEHSESHSTWGVYSMEEHKVLFQRPVGGSPGKYKAARWFFPRVGASASPARSRKKRKFQMLGKDVVHTIRLL